MASADYDKNVLVKRGSLEDAADAIRTKRETEDLIKPEDFASEILKIGGGGVKPTTWAELKAMSREDLQNVFPAGSVIDSISCPWTNTNNTTVYDFKWQVADYGTCLLENDNTEYPCVTLWAHKALPTTFAFDGPEQALCDSSTETVAEAGVYYYGTSAATGSPSTNNITVLNLATGDTIPYDSYARIWKSSVNTTAQYATQLFIYGYNNYKLSNMRQFLNSTTSGTDWFVPTHVGDAKASSYNNHRNFQSGLPADFLNVVSPTKITVLTNTVTDGGAEDVMYDKFFLPSGKEVRLWATPDEGNQWEFIQTSVDRCRYAINGSVMPATSSNVDYWLRSPYRSIVYGEYCASSSGASTNNGAYTTVRVVPACKIILQS